MVFSSLFFLCIFLPLSVIIIRLLPSRFQNIGLLIASLIFYGWGEPKNILIMLCTIIFHYVLAIIIGRYIYKDYLPKILLAVAVIVSIGVLFFFKITVLPIGISFFTFQTLSYTIDVYRRRVLPVTNFFDLSMYISLFPQLIAGPIVRFTDVQDDIKNRDLSYDLFFSGLFRFCVGLGKKVLLANQIGLLWDEISKYNGVMPAATAWLGALAFTFQIYFDFSGYSDMAIGLGHMFGFHFPENFNYPYESKSITEFWRRWHMSLSGWFRDYLYFPLGGSRCSVPRNILNLFIVWLATGLWHGVGWNFLIWGLYYFLLLVVEKYVLKKALSHFPSIVSHIYALFFIIFGWVIFANDDIETLGSYMLSLFGANAGADSMSLYYLTCFGILFITLIIGSTSALKRRFTVLFTQDKAVIPLKSLYMALLLILVFMFLIGDSYNPFLYFRF